MNQLEADTASIRRPYRRNCSCGTCPEIEEEWNWLAKARLETNKHQQLKHQAGRGPCVIFILDTSASIRGQGFRELKEAFTSIIDESSHYPEIDENIAVIVCGQKTKFQRYYSNRYNEIIHCIDDIECKGSSPLAAAMWLSTGALDGVSSQKVERIKLMSSVHVMPRIVMISDGKPTDIRFTSRPEGDATEYATKSAKDQTLRVASRLGKLYPIFCIPVGDNPDVSYLEQLSAVSNGGSIVHLKDVRQFGRYNKHLEIPSIIEPFNTMMPLNKEMLLSVLSQQMPHTSSRLDNNQIDAIVDFVERRGSFRIEDQYLIVDNNDDEKYQELFHHMPPLGSRVKRGPNWKWQNQDAEGIGTVVGHFAEEDGWLYVEWDYGQTCKYRFGKMIYDVIVCNEPRVLNDSELIAAGCLVQRGPDWKWADQDGGPGNIGSVYRVKTDGTVRWSNSVRSNYRFGYGGHFDVEIVVPTANESRPDIDCASGFDHSESTNIRNKQSTSDGSGHTKPYIALPKRSWFWQDTERIWMPYPDAVNDIINDNYEQNPHSTVIIRFDGQRFRVDLSKLKCINVTTKEISEIAWRWT
ncbi:uncharacterized protein LOC125649346 isoform X2 [Ostrea edulis]|uniref:uncharacterized protein LOC125649346 isoform X2 n=1 Tax=Ostrea edulis TaxID=37623 RepID=UPI0024AEEE15|nr:uncharacterized protein LOC125649346 isoform X2 [Ostrea edulis]